MAIPLLYDLRLCVDSYLSFIIYAGEQRSYQAIGLGLPCTKGPCLWSSLEFMNVKDVYHVDPTLNM
jgi:hypothetical protein